MNFLGFGSQDGPGQETFVVSSCIPGKDNDAVYTDVQTHTGVMGAKGRETGDPAQRLLCPVTNHAVGLPVLTSL